MYAAKYIYIYIYIQQRYVTDTDAPNGTTHRKARRINKGIDEAFERAREGLDEDVFVLSLLLLSLSSFICV